MENPSVKVDKHVYNLKETLPTYAIVSIDNIDLRLGKVLKKDSPIIIEE